MGRDERRQGEEVKGDRAGAAVLQGHCRPLGSQTRLVQLPLAGVSYSRGVHKTISEGHDMSTAVSITVYDVICFTGQHAGIFQRGYVMAYHSR